MVTVLKPITATPVVAILVLPNKREIAGYELLNRAPPTNIAFFAQFKAVGSFFILKRPLSINIYIAFSAHYFVSSSKFPN